MTCSGILLAEQLLPHKIVDFFGFFGFEIPSRPSRSGTLLRRFPDDAFLSAAASYPLAELPFGFIKAFDPVCCALHAVCDPRR